MTTPRAMTPGDLARLRAGHPSEHGSDYSRDRCSICGLLTHIDAQAEEVERLRASLARTESALAPGGGEETKG